MIIGLTGGIGSGKSIVGKLLEMLGSVVYSSDESAKALYFRQEIKEKVVRLLGAEAYLENTLNRAYISSRLFSDHTIREQLNNIIHPAVKEDFISFVGRHQNRIVIKESALLFEAGAAADCDQIIVVTAPEKLRIHRVVKRDNIDEKTVLARIASQMSQEEKASRADFIIFNDEQQLVIPQVLKVYKSVISDKHDAS